MGVDHSLLAFLQKFSRNSNCYAWSSSVNIFALFQTPIQCRNGYHSHPGAHLNILFPVLVENRSTPSLCCACHSCCTPTPLVSPENLCRRHASRRCSGRNGPRLASCSPSRLAFAGWSSGRSVCFSPAAIISACTCRACSMMSPAKTFVTVRTASPTLPGTDCDTVALTT